MQLVELAASQHLFKPCFDVKIVNNYGVYNLQVHSNAMFIPRPVFIKYLPEAIIFVFHF
jgi:hypothetical protein